MLAAAGFHKPLLANERRFGFAVRICLAVAIVFGSHYLLSRGAWKDSVSSFHAAAVALIMLTVTGVFQDMAAHRRKLAGYWRTLPLSTAHWTVAELAIGGLLLLAVVALYSVVHAIAGTLTVGEATSFIVGTSAAVPLLRWTQRRRLETSFVWSLCAVVLWAWLMASWFR